MAKFRKKLIFVVILALCLATCLTLVACNPDPPATADYSVTVKIGDNPQEGVTVKLVKDGAEVQQNTDADGKASFDLEKGTYTVSLSNLPAHYVVPANATLTLTADVHDTTIVLEKEFAYVVKLQNLDGSEYAQSGVSVQICDIESLNCCTPVNIDANGVAYIYGWAKSDYHVKVLGLADGYAYECDEYDYYIGGENSNLTSTVTELTVKIYPVVALEKENGTALEEDEKLDLGLDADAVAYKYTKSLAAGEKVYYSITSEISGKFNVYVKKYTEFNSDLSTYGNKLNYYSQGEHFVLGIHLINANTNVPYDSREDLLTEDTPFYYYADNISDQPLVAEFIVVYPNASYNKFSDVNGNVTVTAAKDDAFIEFNPTQAGHYTFTLSNPDATIELEEGSANSYAVYPSDSDAAPTLHIKALADYLNGKLDPISVRIHVDGDTSTEVVVTIAKVDALTHDATVVQPSATIEQATRPDETDGKLELVHIGYTTEIVKSDADGYYHIGDEDGDIVYVLLTETLNTWKLNGSLAYLELASNYGQQYAPQLIMDMTMGSDKADPTKGNIYKDYRLFLRGFNDYKRENTMFGYKFVKPDSVAANCYAEKVNEDGCYPLNQELYDFLNTIVTERYLGASYQNFSHLLKKTMEYDDNAINFALYHYAPYVEPDVIVGEYTVFVSFTAYYEKTSVGDQIECDWDEEWNPIAFKTITDTDYKLVVDKTGNYYIYEFDEENWDYSAEPYESGTWVKDHEGNYTFANNDYPQYPYEEVEFNSETGYLEFNDGGFSGWEFYLAPAEDVE